MRITIAQKLCPFSHRKKVGCVLPGVGTELEIYPALIRFIDGEEQPLDIQGPVERFTVEQDLEKGEVRLYGFAKSGYYKHTIAGKPPTKERLSLGSHKTQDWELIQRRNDPKEILPLWHKLGISLPDVKVPVGGTATLLEKCTDLASLMELYHIAFEGMLVPRLEDSFHQGVTLPPIESVGSPLALLTEGAKKIRNLFFSQEGSQLHILPHLPKELHAGRMVQIASPSIGTLDFEWSKKKTTPDDPPRNQIHIHHIRLSKRAQALPPEKG